MFASVALSNNMEIMFANLTPSWIVGTIEDVDSVVMLPSQECMAEVAVEEPKWSTDEEIDPLEHLVVESHLKSMEMQDELRKMLDAYHNIFTLPCQLLHWDCIEIVNSAPIKQR